MPENVLTFLTLYQRNICHAQRFYFAHPQADYPLHYCRKTVNHLQGEINTSEIVYMEPKQVINSIHIMPATSCLKIEQILKPVRLPKGHLLIRADKIEPSLYLIKSGIVRAYMMREDQEVTFWFGTEEEIILSMRSYTEDKPGYENIELLEDCELFQIKTADLRKLFAEDIDIANWGRKLVERELIKTEQRLISKQFKTGKERYLELMEQHPGLLHRVQLGHIASYLGITQVSLSRIRAEIR